MRIAHRLLLPAVVVCVGLIDSGLGAQPARRGAPRAVPGQLIVKYRANAGPNDRARIHAAAGARAATKLERASALRGASGTELLDVPAAEAAIAARLRLDPSVEYVEPNWIYTHASLPNDPSFPLQWALRNTGQSVLGSRGVAGADIDAPTAWDAVTLTSARPIYVGVIDEGIDFRHPDLGVQPGGAVWTNPFDPADGIDNDGNGYADDVHGWDFAYGDNSVYDGSSANPSIDMHGTHVAGIIAARRNNGLGVAGTASGVVIIPAKFLAPAGGTTAAAIMALDYLTDLKVRHGLDIVAVNNSWTGGAYSQALLDAIARAAREDILFVAASGNGGSDSVGDDNDRIESYPSGYDSTALAGYDAVVGVTATGSSDELMSWANFGYRSVDLGAPGELVLSTTPQQQYGYSSGTSMAAPHVSAAAALVHARRGIAGHALREALLASVDPVPSLAGRTSTGGRLNVARAVGASGSGGTSSSAEVVLYAADAQKVAGNWAVVSDSSAAGGRRMQSANRGAAKLLTALASPASYFELTFYAEAGKPYRLWMRGRAEGNAWANDSVHVQFDRTVSGGSPAYRIGTTSALAVNLEDCSGCGLSGWGWQDTAYGRGIAAAPLYFASSGTQRIRVQIREDGFGIDQIVLSNGAYLTASPGALKNDSTILPPRGSVPDGSPAGDAPVKEIVLHASTATMIRGQWAKLTDASAAGGGRLQSANAGAPKLTTALASPAHYFELSFRADKGTPYRLWIRGKALSNSWANDSVHVQFSDSVTGTGAPIYRIGTTSATAINLEDCLSCGLSGWGWQDNGWGRGVRGPDIQFAATGTHVIRVQVREDGLGIDQIVLSAGTYLLGAPGALKNDTVILPKTAP